MDKGASRTRTVALAAAGTAVLAVLVATLCRAAALQPLNSDAGCGIL